MIQLIKSPSLVEAAGNKPKRIEEFFGRVNSQSHEVSIAKMTSPKGWIEPGQAILIGKGEWVQYTSPYEGGAEYVAVCLPAFAMETVHRDD